MMRMKLAKLDVIEYLPLSLYKDSGHYILQPNRPPANKLR